MSEEGGRPTSTIFMLHEGLSQLITMVTFFCPLALLSQRTDHPPYPPPPKKNMPSVVTKVVLLGQLFIASCIAEVIQVTDLISH